MGYPEVTLLKPTSGEEWSNSGDAAFCITGPTKSGEQFPNSLLPVIENARKISSYLHPVD